MAVHTSLNSLFTDIADKLRDKGCVGDGNRQATWIESTLPNTGVDWEKVCYGDGKFVAIPSETDVAAYSTDGVVWVTTTLPVSCNWRDVCYGDGKFVAIGSIAPTSASNWQSQDVAAYSVDGIVWVEGAISSGSDWYSVCYGNGIFVAHSNVWYYRSTDGMNWERYNTLPGNGASTWESICYGNDLFVIAPQRFNQVAYSVNGINWSTSTLPSTDTYKVSFGNGRFVAVGQNTGVVAYSYDGINWKESSLPSLGSGASWRTICYGGGKFVAAAYESSVMAYSADGISWVEDSLPSSDCWESSCYGNEKFVIISTCAHNRVASREGNFSSGIVADNFPTMIEKLDSLNIAYGSTPPDDTSKLWIPLTTKPDNVEISIDNLETAVDSIATKTAVLPTATSGASSVEIDGKIYIFGGSVSATRTQILVYDPATDTITTAKRTVMADDGSTTEEDVVMPANSYYAAAVAINGKAYIFGGNSYATTIYEFDPVAGTVTKKAALADGVQYASAVAINGKAYIFGGMISSTGNTDMIQEYDPVTDTCVDTGINLAAKTYGTAALAINGKAYIFGGYNYLDTIQEYDPFTQKIKTKETVLLDGMSYASAVTINGKAYIFGGQTGSSAREDMIQEYDPITDTITEKTGVLAVGLAQATASVANGKAYIFGGTSGSNTNTIQEYTVKSYLAENNVKLMATAVASGGEQIVTSIVNSKTGQVKMHILSAFVGDADGYAAPQEAYIYDTEAAAWKSLSGSVYTG